MKKLLVINAGSSSMKFEVYEKEGMKSIANGMAERIFVDGVFLIEFKGNKNKFEHKMNSHKDAVNFLIKQLKDLGVVKNLDEIIGIGHRIVQGGEEFKESVLIDNVKVLDAIDKHSSLAPLHNPGELAAAKSFMELIPNAKNVGVFDTSFHQSMPKINFMYATPAIWYEKFKVRRYGMHGTSHKYIAQEMGKILNKKPNLIICHLGNGASLSAIQAGKSINTSMGLTPLAGIVMGTRSGDLDPAIIEYMCETTGKSVKEITSSLNKESGMLALSGISSDFRDITTAAQKGDANAKFSIEYYAKRVADYIVMYQNDLKSKVDAIVFTAGVGENAVNVRKAIIDAVHTMDVKIDDSKNTRDMDGHKVISTNDSKVAVYAMSTNEEIMIVKDLIKLANL